jgi:hypothetical protein
VRDAIARVTKTTGKPAVTATGQPQEHGDDVEITGILNLKKWPVGGSSSAVSTPPGCVADAVRARRRVAYQAVATKTPVATGGQVAFLEARHRAHARVETRIRHAKDSGTGRFPSREYDINAAWAIAASISADLIAWLRLLALAPGLKALRTQSAALPVPAGPPPASPTAAADGTSASLTVVIGAPEETPAPCPATVPCTTDVTANATPSGKTTGSVNDPTGPAPPAPQHAGTAGEAVPPARLAGVEAGGPGKTGRDVELEDANAQIARCLRRSKTSQ